MSTIESAAEEQPAEPVSPEASPPEVVTRQPGALSGLFTWRLWTGLGLVIVMTGGWALAFHYYSVSESQQKASEENRAKANDLSQQLYTMTTQHESIMARENGIKIREDLVKTREEAAFKQETAHPKQAITEGNWAVGVDVQPGTYRTETPVIGGCYWEIDSDPNGNNIVANDNVTGGRPTVTLKSGQYFTTKDCGEWIKV